MLLQHANHKRSGIVLLVVLALLSLFAIVGLAFVFYADAEAQSAKHFADAQVATRGDINTEVLAAYFLGQMLYDLKDDERGAYSALRGQSLARSIHGFNSSSLNFTAFNV